MSALCACSRAAKLSVTAATAARSSFAVTRSFSTTSTLATEFRPIPPQSPEYITVPRPAQDGSDEIKPPRVKGTLPPPRQIFTDKPHDSKFQDDYLERTAPLPSNAASLREVPKDSVTDIRRRMAAARRHNLAAGLTGLLDRKQRRDARVEERNITRRKESAKIRNMPEREDDILTRSTVLQSHIKQIAVSADPKRFERAAESKARTAQHMEDTIESRRSALMDLYSAAREFIVSEEHLAMEVDRIFSDDYFKKHSRSHATDATNAWEVWGIPPTLAQINSGAHGTFLHEWDTSDSKRAGKRQKSIAEELTGGKMD